MQHSEIVKGGRYRAVVNGNVTTVKVLEIRESFSIGFSGRNYGKRRETYAYEVENTATGRRTTFRNARKFRGVAAPPAAPVRQSPAVAETVRPAASVLNVVAQALAEGKSFPQAEAAPEAPFFAEPYEISRGEYHQRCKALPGYDVAQTNRRYWMIVGAALQTEGCHVPEEIMRQYVDLHGLPSLSCPRP